MEKATYAVNLDGGRAEVELTPGISLVLFIVELQLQRLSNVFKVKELQEANTETFRCKRKSEIQYDSQQTGNAGISASGQDSCDSQRPNSRLSRTRNYITLVPILFDVRKVGNPSRWPSNKEMLVYVLEFQTSA
jgi:hypothetical protein